MQKGLTFLFLLLSLTVLGQLSKNMSLLKQWSASQATGYNDVWGYEASGREYAIIGSNWGTHFLDISADLSEAQEIASFEGLANDVTWRDFKTYQHYAYGVADGDSNSLQIFDLQYLPDSVVKVYDSRETSESSHNIFISDDRLYLCANQILGNKGNQALHVLSLADPENPTPLRAFDKSYFGNELLHDIQVRDGIAYCSAGYGGLYIYDLTDINNEILLGVLDIYPDQGYNHSSWLSDDLTKLVVADEVPSGLPLKLFDVADPENMEYLDRFRSHTGATPHNPFMLGNLIIVSYYMDGVVVFDYSDPFDVRKVAYYDTYPDNTDYSNFGPYNGCWGTYPYLPSGSILGSDRTYGLFVLSLDTAAFTSTPQKWGTRSSIFPNPVTDGQLFMQTTARIAQWQLTDVHGQLLMENSGTTFNHVYRIPMGDHPKGMYFISLLYEDGTLENHRIIKK